MKIRKLVKELEFDEKVSLNVVKIINKVIELVKNNED